MATINITTDAGFKGGVGSIGITFWSNDDVNGFKSVNYVVQNVIFISNYEAELFGIYAGLLKLSKILEKKERGERIEIPFFDSLANIEAVNIYCDNYTALSCFGVIHTLGTLAVPLGMSEEMIINLGVHDFFYTMATFTKTPYAALRTHVHELLVRRICEKLFDVFNFLKYRVTIGYMRHVHGHSISGDKDVGIFKKIFSGKKEMVMIPSINRQSFLFSSIRTANTYVELYSNCIADAVASRRTSDLERFSNVCVIDDHVEEADRYEIACEHRYLVVFRRICSIQNAIEITADKVDFVSSLSICPRLFDRIKQTFDRLFEITEAEVVDRQQYADAIKSAIAKKPPRRETKTKKTTKQK